MRTNKQNINIFRISVACCMLFMAALSSALAIDVQPRDYVYLPAGTNLALVYYDYAHRSSINFDNGPTYSRGTNLDSHIGIVRYVHYSELAGLPVVAEFLVPFGSLNDGKVNGTKLDSAEGFADPYFAFVAWPYRNTEQGTEVAVASYTQPPLGTYDHKQVLNLGTNRWTQDFQVSLTQSIGSEWTFDLLGDVIYYSNNTDANASGQTLRQDLTWQLQSWLSYDVTSSSYVALGYNGYFGGRQHIAGTYNGLKTSLNEIRGTYAQFVTPTVQVLGSLYHDVSVNGGFKRDIGLTLRFLKVF